MNWLDIVFLIVVLGSVITSISNGFSREAIGFATTLAALLAGIWFYGVAGNFLMDYVSSPRVAHFCGFVLLFAGVWVLGAIIGHFLGRVVKAAGLSFFDRLLGAVFGALKGVLVCIALLMAIMAFTPGARADAPPRSVVESKFAPYVTDAADYISRIAPYELKEGYRKTYEQVKKIWKDSMGTRELPPTVL